MLMPVSPARLTSFSSRLLVPKSAPAAPAVAKKPMTIWITRQAATSTFGPPGAGVNLKLPTWGSADTPAMHSMATATQGR